MVVFILSVLDGCSGVSTLLTIYGTFADAASGLVWLWKRGNGKWGMGCAPANKPFLILAGNFLILAVHTPSFSVIEFAVITPLIHFLQRVLMICIALEFNSEARLMLPVIAGLAFDLSSHVKAFSWKQ